MILINSDLFSITINLSLNPTTFSHLYTNIQFDYFDQQTILKHHLQHMEPQEIQQYTKIKPYETEQMHQERTKVFFLALAKTNNIDQAIKFANIHNNIKYLGCKYPQALTEQLATLLQIT